MAILNITPDSFSGDGQVDTAAVIRQALLAETDGADILDLGAESTRPGANLVDAATEQARLMPILHALRPRTKLRLSVDTYKAQVAEAALAAGADLINDVWAGSYDGDMFRVVAAAGCPIVLMHNRTGGGEKETSRTAPPPVTPAYQAAVYRDVVQDVIADLSRRIDAAHSAGVRDSQIIVDPGIGFGKSVADNLRLIRGVAQIKAALPYPLLLGPSRKSFIGAILGGLPVSERLEGTAAAVALGVAYGADILRVHDVHAMARVMQVAGAIAGA
jgi:dihydropteroate synthase